MTGGRRANQAGRAAEECIAQMLTYHGIVYTRQARVGLSVFEGDLCVDFLVHNLVEHPDGLVIESRWQDVRGSAQEKLLYIIENIRASAYGHSLLLVLNGGGFTAGARTYLRQQIDGDYLVDVVDFAGLLSWLQRKVHPICVRP